MSADTAFRTGHVAIVGRPNVGKSTLLNRLVGQKLSITSRRPQTTRHRIVGILTRPDAQYVFVDTPGIQNRHGSQLNRLMNRSATASLEGVDAIVLVIEALRFGPADQQVLGLLDPSQQVVLAINKTDALQDKARLLPFLAQLAQRFAFHAMVPLSAKNGTHSEELLAALRPLLPEGIAAYGEDELTDRSERFLAEEFLREKLFRLLGQELPYAAAVEIERFETEGDFRRIYASVIVDKPGQKAIVIGEGGEKLKQIATQARLDMEKLFGGKVFLEVWVKVKSGWADDPRALKRLGYG